MKILAKLHDLQRQQCKGLKELIDAVNAPLQSRAALPWNASIP